MKLQPADLFTRIFFILVLTFIPSAFTFVILIALIQLFMDIFKQPQIPSLVIISKNIIGYIVQIVNYLTAQSKVAPFPFSPWNNHHDT